MPSTTTPALPEITGATAEELNASFKAAWAACTKEGNKGPAPMTANALREAHRQALAALVEADAKAARRTSAPKAAKAEQTYTKNGKPLARHSLSFAAWAATKNLGGADVARVGVEALKAELRGLGVAEPESTTWAVLLSNDVVLAATVAGETPIALPASVTQDQAHAAPSGHTRPAKAARQATPAPKPSAAKRARQAAKA